MKRATVVNILNSKQIAIDYGINQGAKIGEKVRIIEQGEEIYDFTKEKRLGTLDIIKEEVEIVRVYENFSICSKVTRKSSSLFQGINALSIQSTNIEELNVEPDQINNIYLPHKTPIKNGDVVQIF